MIPGIFVSRVVEVERRNALTYFKQDSSCGPCAFGDVDCVAVRWVGDHGEDLGGKPDWGTFGVCRFLGLAAAFGKRGTSEGD